MSQREAKRVFNQEPAAPPAGSVDLGGAAAVPELKCQPCKEVAPESEGEEKTEKKEKKKEKKEKKEKKKSKKEKKRKAEEEEDETSDDTSKKKKAKKEKKTSKKDKKDEKVGAAMLLLLKKQIRLLQKQQSR